MKIKKIDNKSEVRKIIENGVFLGVSKKEAKNWKKNSNLWPIVYRKFYEWLIDHSVETIDVRRKMTAHKFMIYCWNRFEMDWQKMLEKRKSKK